MQYWSKELWVVDIRITWSLRIHNTWIVGSQRFTPKWTKNEIVESRRESRASVPHRWRRHCKAPRTLLTAACRQCECYTHAIRPYGALCAMLSRTDYICRVEFRSQLTTLRLPTCSGWLKTNIIYASSQNCLRLYVVTLRQKWVFVVWEFVANPCDNMAQNKQILSQSQFCKWVDDFSAKLKITAQGKPHFMLSDDIGARTAGSAAGAQSNPA